MGHAGNLEKTTFVQYFENMKFMSIILQTFFISYFFIFYSFNFLLSENTPILKCLNDMINIMESKYLYKRRPRENHNYKPVSYTHLTLPTMCVV